jgi:hypothetical protein
MAGLVPTIHVLRCCAIKKDVDARDRRGHDDFIKAASPHALKYAIWCVVASRRPFGDQSSPVWSP